MNTRNLEAYCLGEGSGEEKDTSVFGGAEGQVVPELSLPLSATSQDPRTQESPI